VAVDPILQTAYVTHLSTGVVSLLYAPTDDTKAPELINFISTLFAPNRNNGALGAVGVASRTPGDPDGFIYVTSRQEARIATMTLSMGGTLPDGAPSMDLVRGPSSQYAGLNEPGATADARSITFTPDGNTAYVVNRTPPAIFVLDTSLDATGAPRNAYVATA